MDLDSSRCPLHDTHFRDAFDRNPVAMALVDAADRSVSWNRTARALLGIGDGLGGDAPFAITHPHDGPLPPERWPPWRALAGEVVLPEAVTVEHAGSYTRVSLSASPLRDERGAITCALVLIHEAGATCDRQAVEARERQRSEELRAWLWATPSLVLIAHDRECREVAGSRVAHRLLGIPEGGNLAPFCGGDGARPPLFCRNGQPLPPEALPLLRAAGGEEVWDEELDVCLPDGGVRHLVGNATPLLGPDGIPDGAIATFTDITRLKQAETELRESERRYRLLAEANPIGVVGAAVGGPEMGRITTANDAFLRLVGAGRDELAAGRLRWTDLTPPEDLPLDAAAIAEARAKGHCTPYEKAYRRRDGSLVPVLVACAVVDPTGDEAVAFAVDLSAQKAAAEALRRSETLLRRVVDTVPVGIFVADPQGRIFLTNPAAGRIWADGHHVDPARYGEYRGWWPGTGRRVEPHEWGLARAVERGETSLDEEIDIEAFDGTRRTILNSALPLQDDAGQVLGAIATNVDITERRELERQLQASHAFLTKVTENVSNAVVVVDPEGCLLSANPPAAALTGYGRDELVGMPYTTLLDPADRPAMDALFLQVTRRLQPVLGHEVTIVRKDGGRRLTVFNAVPMREGREVANSVVTAEDVTERRRAEAALRRSEERFREFFEHAPVGLVITALDGRFLHVNPAYCRIVGYSADELLQEEFDFRRLTDARDLPHNALEYERLLAGEVPAFFIEKRYIRKDGSRVWVRASASLRRDAEGRPLHVVGLVEDIDARKRGEEDRRILEAMMEHIPMGITIADAPDVRIRTVSRFGRELLERGPSELEDIPAKAHPQRWGVLRADGSPPASADELPLTRATLRGELVREEEWVLVRRDGTQVPILCTAAPIRDGEGRIIAGVIGWQDIRGLKRMERQLRRMNAELEEFAYVASHDLKAPLRAIGSLAAWIRDDAAERLDEENRGRLQQVQERVARMNQLIDGLLTYARLGHGGSPAGVALTPLLQEMVADLAPPPGFGVELQEPLPALWGDPLQLRQLFQNLMANAIHHHDRPAQGHVRVSARDDGDHWCLEVADDGPGIPPEARERVFRMFATGGKAGHSGIGLAIVRKIARANGGDVKVQDNVPRGTRFHVRWPKRVAV